MKALLWLAPSLLLGQANWTVPAGVAALGYTLKVMHDGCRSEACLVLIPPPNAPSQAPGTLMESLDPADVRGERLRLRAWVRLERPGPGDRAQLWVRVDRPGGVLGFYDPMGDRPITSSEWRSYEIVGEIAADAEAVSVGVRSSGKARVWVDGVSVEKLPPAGKETGEARDAIAKIYAAVDAAYGAGDMDAIAGYAAADASLVIGETRSPLSAVLGSLREQIAKGAKIRSISVITALRVTGSEAQVWVNNESALTTGAATHKALSVNRDVWTKTASGWKLKQSTLIATDVGK